MAAPSAAREVFRDGVRAVLHTWPVLQIAVDNGFGGLYGQEKADWMVDVIQQYFHDNADLDQYEVEDYISSLMDQEFNTVVDDGSLPQVSGTLMQMFALWQQGALQQLRLHISKLTHNTQRAKVTAPPAESDQDSDDHDGDAERMECDTSSPSASSSQAPPPPPPPQDEGDGWTVVRRKK